MKILLQMLVAGALAQMAASAQFVLTPFNAVYHTNSAQIYVRCAYFLDPARTYVGEQIDPSGRRIRTVGLATLTTGGGTVVNHWQLQNSLVQPKPDLLYRIVDTTGASASRIAELRDIPFGVYPPSANLVPTGTPTYKTALSKGVFSLTAERKFGEWFLLEEFRNGYWSQARWMPLGGKSSVVLGQRFIGTGEPPNWRVSTWKTGVAPQVTPPLPPGFQVGEPAGGAFVPSAAVVDNGIISDWYHDRTNGVFYAWANQSPNHNLIFEDSDNATGPWTERAFWTCSPQSLLVIATFNGSMERRFIRARLVPCSNAVPFESAGAAFGENIVVPTRKGPRAIIRLHSPTMRLSPGWNLYTAAIP